MPMKTLKTHKGKVRRKTTGGGINGEDSFSDEVIQSAQRLRVSRLSAEIDMYYRRWCARNQRPVWD